MLKSCDEIRAKRPRRLISGHIVVLLSILYLDFAYSLPVRDYGYESYYGDPESQDSSSRDDSFDVDQVVLRPQDRQSYYGFDGQPLVLYEDLKCDEKAYVVQQAFEAAVDQARHFDEYAIFNDYVSLLEFTSGYVQGMKTLSYLDPIEVSCAENGVLVHATITLGHVDTSFGWKPNSAKYEEKLWASASNVQMDTTVVLSNSEWEFPTMSISTMTLNYMNDFVSGSESMNTLGSYSSIHEPSLSKSDLTYILKNVLKEVVWRQLLLYIWQAWYSPKFYSSINFRREHNIASFKESSNNIKVMNRTKSLTMETDSDSVDQDGVMDNIHDVGRGNKVITNIHFEMDRKKRQAGTTSTSKGNAGAGSEGGARDTGPSGNANAGSKGNANAAEQLGHSDTKSEGNSSSASKGNGSLSGSEKKAQTGSDAGATVGAGGRTKAGSDAGATVGAGGRTNAGATAGDRTNAGSDAGATAGGSTHAGSDVNATGGAAGNLGHLGHSDTKSEGNANSGPSGHASSVSQGNAIESSSGQKAQTGFDVGATGGAGGHRKAESVAGATAGGRTNAGSVAGATDGAGDRTKAGSNTGNTAGVDSSKHAGSDTGTTGGAGGSVNAGSDAGVTGGAGGSTNARFDAGAQVGSAAANKRGSDPSGSGADRSSGSGSREMALKKIDHVMSPKGPVGNIGPVEQVGPGGNLGPDTRSEGPLRKDGKGGNDRGLSGINKGAIAPEFEDKVEVQQEKNQNQGDATNRGKPNVGNENSAKKTEGGVDNSVDGNAGGAMKGVIENNSETRNAAAEKEESKKYGYHYSGRSESQAPVGMDVDTGSLPNAIDWIGWFVSAIPGAVKKNDADKMGTKKQGNEGKGGDQNSSLGENSRKIQLTINKIKGEKKSEKKSSAKKGPGESPDTMTEGNFEKGNAGPRANLSALPAENAGIGPGRKSQEGNVGQGANSAGTVGKMGPQKPVGPQEAIGPDRKQIAS